MKTHLRLVAGQPMNEVQQRAVLRSAFSFERVEEVADEASNIAGQFMNAMGWIFVGAVVIAAVFVITAVVLSLGVS